MTVTTTSQLPSSFGSGKISAMRTLASDGFVTQSPIVPAVGDHSRTCCVRVYFWIIASRQAFAAAFVMPKYLKPIRA